MAAISSIGQLLISAQSGDLQSRTNAQTILQNMTQTQPAQYLLDLSAELANEHPQKLARQLAGLAIKNTVINANQDPFLDGLWINLPPESKAQIRNNTLCTLATNDRDIRLVAAQAVSSIAKLDIPRGEWPDILGILINNSTHVDIDVKMISLTTLGYICEELPDDIITKHTSDQILTAICANINDVSAKDDLKLIAIQALRNSIPFTKENFRNDSERVYLINLLCDSCSNRNLHIRVAILQVICDVAAIYYDYIETSLIQLGNLTYNAIRQDELQPALLGIEFWNIIGDIERANLDAGQPIRGYIKTAAESLIPMLLEKISAFEEDDDEWNLHKASATTIAAIAPIIGDKIVELSASYVQREISSSD